MADTAAVSEPHHGGLLRELSDGDPIPDPCSWFDRIAERLLRRSWLGIDGVPHELVEIEFYLRSSSHPDPYVHGDPRQRTCGHWYFHRTGRSFRGGTYKGLDLTFGPDDAYGGILIRSLRTPDGALISGSSLCVDYILDRTRSPTVASLAARVEERAADAEDSVLRLSVRDRPADAFVWRTARVGLTLKRIEQHPEMTDFIFAPYRQLTEPRKISKGRPQLVIAMHQQGLSSDEICRATGSPRSSVLAYLAAYEEGRAATGEVASAVDAIGLCRAHGMLARSPGSTR